MTSVSAASESAGTTLLKALLNEIQQMPKPWEETPEREQAVVIDRLRRAVDSSVRGLVRVIAGGSFPHIPATVESVAFKDGVKAVLTLSKGQDGTHALADATGGQAMVVLASAQEFLEGMERVQAENDQADMFEQEYAAVSSEGWQKLIESLEEQPPETQLKSIGEQCQEILARVHVYVELEVCEQWTERECTVAAYWALQFAKDPDTAPARPHWLPLPDPSRAQAGEGEHSDDEDSTEGDDSPEPQE